MTFGVTVQKVIKFERLFRLKEMFNRVILTGEPRHGPRNQSNGSTPNGVIHIYGQNVIFHTISHPRISCSFWLTTQVVVVSYPVPHGQTVDADYHKFLLQYHICRTVKRPEILQTAISLHDNVTVRSVGTVKGVFWRVMGHTGKTYVHTPPQFMPFHVSMI
jgi:hypothetical protein